MLVTGVSPVSSSGLLRYVGPAAISVAVAFIGVIRVVGIKDDRVATKSVFVDSQSNLRRQLVQEGRMSGVVSRPVTFSLSASGTSQVADLEIGTYAEVVRGNGASNVVGGPRSF
jgi:hypothetical protein